MFSPNTYEKYIVSKKSCIVHHDDKMCVLPNCRQHIKMGDIKNLIERFNTFCFNYLSWTGFLDVSSIVSVASLLSRADYSLTMCGVQLFSTNKREERIKCRAWRNRDCWGKSMKNICSALSKKLKRCKSVDQFLQTELNKLKRLKSK